MFDDDIIQKREDAIKQGDFEQLKKLVFSSDSHDINNQQFTELFHQHLIREHPQNTLKELIKEAKETDSVPENVFKLAEDSLNSGKIIKADSLKQKLLGACNTEKENRANPDDKMDMGQTLKLFFNNIKGKDFVDPDNQFTVPDASRLIKENSASMNPEMHITTTAPSTTAGMNVLP